MDRLDILAQMLRRNRKRCVIIPHISPDGDAIGACSALCQVLRGMNHFANIVTCDVIPEYLTFLPLVRGSYSLQHKADMCRKFIEEADIIFMLDHNSVRREGDLEPLVIASRAKKVIIDHHLEPDDADVVISHPELSSTCELMYTVIRRVWGLDAVTPTVADALYTGINTDTGGFNHNSSRPEVYRVVADLLMQGLNKDFVHHYLYQCNRLSKYRLMGNILLNKLTIDGNYPLALMPITLDELQQYDFHDGDLEGVVNIPLAIKNVEVAIQVTERKEQIKLSFRSKGSVPVNEWAKAHFEGGGHLNAAGGRTTTTLQETLDKINATAPWFFETYCQPEEGE